MTELLAAERIATGAEVGPLIYGNSSLVALRISGTGCAYRASLDEFAWREPAIWLSDAMRRRFCGVPVVVEHPAGGILDAQSFRDSVVGIVVWSFVREGELWGIARFWDAEVAQSITDPDGRFAIDTSPSVAFGADQTVRLALEDGRELLIEGTPALIDHVALLVSGEEPGGVWTRNGIAGIDKSKPKETTDG